jgi:hypothetical protein
MTNTLAYFDLPSAMLKTVFIIPRQSKEMTNTLAYFEFLKDENSFTTPKPGMLAMKTFLAMML